WAAEMPTLPANASAKAPVRKRSRRMIASISFGVRVRYLPPYGLPKRSHASHARAPQNISRVGSTDTPAEAGLWFQCREGVAVITSRRTSVGRRLKSRCARAREYWRRIGEYSASAPRQRVRFGA